MSIIESVNQSKATKSNIKLMQLKKQIRRKYYKTISLHEIQEISFEYPDIKDKLWSLGETYAKQSTIHGVNRFFCRTTGRKERILWSLSCLTALFLLIYLCLLLAGIYNRKQLKTVIEATRYPAYKVPFPEIALCNKNRLNWARLAEAQQRFLLPEHRNKIFQIHFANIISRYDTLTFGTFNVFDNLPLIALQTLNYINFTSVVHFMAWRCDEMFEECFWQNRPYNCCDIIFPRISQLGRCLAFNSIESKEGKQKQFLDEKWPWRANKYGPGNGFKAKLLLQTEKHYRGNNNDKGLTFMVSEPYVWFSNSQQIATNTKAQISINAILNIRDNDTKSVTAEQRGCVFESEKGHHHFKLLKGYDVYMFENCQSECHQETLMRYCNCTMDLFFPASSNRPCKLVDLLCLAKHNHHMLHLDRSEGSDTNANATGIKCKCLMKCPLSLKYINIVTSTALSDNDIENTKNVSFIDLDFYFLKNYIIVYRTKMVFTWLDLLVSFGGVAGLFLGCSLFSVVELVYLLFVDVMTIIWHKKTNIKSNNTYEKVTYVE